MDLSGGSFPFLILFPAGATLNRKRVDISFGNFIPPLLLPSGPNLFFAAITAHHQPVDIENRQWAISIIVRQFGLICDN